MLGKLTSGMHGFAIAKHKPVAIPEYDLTVDDFIDTGDDALVSFEREDNAEAYNHVPVKFINRDNGYEQEVAEAKVQVDINRRGLRSMSEVNLPYLHTKERAEYVANLLVNASLYGRNKYRFKLGWSHCLLEPGDFITIYDPIISPNSIPVIVNSIEEDEDGVLDVKVTARRPGANSAARYTTHGADRFMIDRNADPGNINTPIIFDAPKELTTANGFEMWMAISGSGPYWGGCNIWISEDDLTYKMIGTIKNPSRTGVLANNLSIGNNLDLVNVLSTNMSESKAELLPGTQLDVEHLNTLCYVDGEFIAYRNADLTGINQYNLSYLMRGVYKSPIVNHPIGSHFARLDDAIFKHPYRVEDINKVFYFKFTSFNVWGFAEQSLDEVQKVIYPVSSNAFPDDVIELADYVEGNAVYLTWKAVDDIRPICYEIRKGDTWESAEFLNRTTETKYKTVGDGHYWVAAYYKTLYSPNPVGVIISGSNAVKNYLVKYNEAETGWTGEKFNSYALNGILYLGAIGDIYEAEDVYAIPDIYNYGGVPETGIYIIPEDHQVALAKAAKCPIYFETEVFDGSATVQVRCAGNDNVFGEWQNAVNGQEYIGKIFDFRVVLNSSGNEVRLSKFIFAVDAPELFDRFVDLFIPYSGLDLVFNQTFNTKPGLSFLILDEQPGDRAVITNHTKTGARIQIYNGNSPVERYATATAIGC